MTKPTAAANAAGLPDEREVLFAYRQWLHHEGRLLGAEIYADLGDHADRYIPETFAKYFHFPNDSDWRDVPKPSTRAELVLQAVGALPGTTDETTAKARVAWHYRQLKAALSCLHQSLGQPASTAPTIAISHPIGSGDEVLEAVRAGLRESIGRADLLPKNLIGKHSGKRSLRKTV